MFYTYVLISIKTKRKYIGFTSNLRRRLMDHNEGKGGKYTRANRPFVLVFFEGFLSEKDARAQEKFYKTGCGREVLKDKIENSLREIN